MRVELSRFRVKPGKSGEVDEWMRMLNDRMPEVLLTLEREQMFIEVIFRERLNGEEFLYWFSIQDEEGESVETSPHDVDKKHMEFWRDCIDPAYGEHVCEPQVIMIPKQIAKAMGWSDLYAVAGKSGISTAPKAP